ncbi:DUF3791 domain-containing protein [Anaerostipes caccae]|uniref:DUF3791 domain-containing protein n=1 Tax=Anaerostipes caccae TaxID=105841 RepID=UPI00101BD1BC|nr:DUF3791 domain-containing protein [Anaerostipes caccae]
MSVSKEMKFFIYLIERYAQKKGIPTPVILEQWDKLDLTMFILDMYELYHSEAIENAFDDIDRLVLTRTCDRL